MRIGTFEPGAEVLLEGKRYRIHKVVGVEGVLLIDEGSVTRSIQNFSEWEAETLNQGKYLCPFSSRSKLHVPFKSSEGHHAGRAAAPP